MTSELLADSFLKTLFNRFYHTLQLHSPLLHRDLQVTGCSCVVLGRSLCSTHLGRANAPYFLMHRGYWKAFMSTALA